MVSAIYVMKNISKKNMSKFGHRTEQTIEDIRNAINKEYSRFGYECIMLYTFETDNDNVEKLVTNVRKIINLISGNLTLEHPEYYEIEPIKITEVLDVLMDLHNLSQGYKLNKISV